MRRRSSTGAGRSRSAALLSLDSLDGDRLQVANPSRVTNVVRHDDAPRSFDRIEGLAAGEPTFSSTDQSEIPLTVDESRVRHHALVKGDEFVALTEAARPAGTLFVQVLEDLRISGEGLERFRCRGQRRPSARR